MLSVCSVTPSCSSQSKITFHGGLRPFLPFPKDFQVGSHVTADGSFTGLLRGTQFHGGFPKAFTTRSSLSNLTMNAQHPLSTGEGTLLDVSGLRSEITSAQVLPIQHETGLGDKIASEKMLFLSDSLNVDNSSVSNLKASTEDFLDRVSESFNASIQQGENTIEKSLDTINSFVSSLIKRGNQSVDDAVSSIFSSVDQIGEQGSNKVTNFSSGLKEGSIKASIAAIDLLRHAVVAIEDSLINATSFVVYSYGSAKELFPPEIRIALSSSEQKVAEILSPVKTGFQQIYPTVESLEKIVGLDPSDPLVPFFLLVGSSVTLWIFYWTNTYGGYSGDLSPEATLELLKGSDNAVLIDVRPEDLREKDGIPDLRRGARARYTSVTLPEVDGSIRKLVTNGRDLDDTLLASVIRNLKIVQDRSKVIVMDANGTGSKNVARSLRKLGVKKPYLIQGGYQSWVKQGLRIKELKPETPLSILNEEAEAILEEINPSPVQVLSYGLGLAATLYALLEWETSLQIIAILGIGQTIYRRVTSYEDAEDLNKDVRLLLTPVSLGAQALSWAAEKLETNGNGLPTSPSSLDVQNRVLQAAAKHESQPSVDEGIQNRPPEAAIPVSEGIDLSEA
ncbi:uncharacterized protein LOC101220363 [Cucumis sativus]|uniref:Rhodanese domain-containing protein n=1 Tax=Cucumis sativus TaxID=3659 RepID=A0A0A0LQV3_CUCSA|nr:uncharacterized protein LOC101220363 [Cucumis sativus]KGN62371.1 hypothetical protein Csa_018540 [Cucumis sativus]